MQIMSGVYKFLIILRVFVSTIFHHIFWLDRLFLSEFFSNLSSCLPVFFLRVCISLAYVTRRQTSVFYMLSFVFLSLNRFLRIFFSEVTCSVPANIFHIISSVSSAVILNVELKDLNEKILWNRYFSNSKCWDNPFFLSSPIHPLHLCSDHWLPNLEL